MEELNQKYFFTIYEFNRSRNEIQKLHLCRGHLKTPDELLNKVMGASRKAEKARPIHSCEPEIL